MMVTDIGGCFDGNGDFRFLPLPSPQSISGRQLSVFWNENSDLSAMASNPISSMITLWEKNF